MNIAVSLEHMVLFTDFDVTHIDGDMSRFAIVGIFSLGLRMIDVGHSRLTLTQQMPDSPSLILERARMKQMLIWDLIWI